MIQIGNMHQQSNQLIQSPIAVFDELEEQQDPFFTNNKRRTNLFLALDEKLQNKIVRFKKPHTMHEKP